MIPSSGPGGLQVPNLWARGETEAGIIGPRAFSSPRRWFALRLVPEAVILPPVVAMGTCGLPDKCRLTSWVAVDTPQDG